MRRCLLLVAVIMLITTSAFAQTIDDPVIENETPSPQATSTPGTTSSPDPDDTPEPSPTLDPDDVAMELPGLPPLPDPATLERTDDVRRPGTPRTPRSASDDRRDVLPAVDRDRRDLPASGREIGTLGTGGGVLVLAGMLLLWIVRTTQRRGRRLAVATSASVVDATAPPWGTDSLIGW